MKPALRYIYDMAVFRCGCFVVGKPVRYHNVVGFRFDFKVDPVERCHGHGRGL